MESIKSTNLINTNNETNLKNDDIQINSLNEFEKLESNDKLSLNQFKPQFDFYKEFEMRDIIENNSSNNEIQQDEKEIDLMLNSFPIINDNIRANIQLSIEIYKKINNFDINYLHEIISEKTKK